MKRQSVLNRGVLPGLVALFFLLLTGWGAFGQSEPSLGDANGDGGINIVDAMVVARYTINIATSPFYFKAADVDGDGAVEIMDALLIAQYSAGIIASFPASNPGGIQILQSSVARENPQLAAGELEAVATGNNQFAFDFYKQLQANSGNLFFSPVSLTFAFAMCYAGANGNTETEMARALHFTLPDDRLHNALNYLDLQLTADPVYPANVLLSKGEDLKLRITNASWGERDYTFLPQYLDVLAKYYGAGMKLVSFKTQPENSRLLINDWVAAQTEQRIKDLLPQGTIDAYTRLVLTNAIYFKANWLNPFNAADTASGPFTLLDGSTVTASLMLQKTTTGYFEVPGQYQALRLPYQGQKKNAMYIILPAAGQFQNVENSFTLDTFNSILQGQRPYQVTLKMPKFSFDASYSLKTVLQALGMKDAFAPGIADFSGINGAYDLYISGVLQKAFVAVDEKGTEASAATAIVISATSMPPVAAMTIDRPFLFLIYNEDTNTILFLGRVARP